VKIEQQTELYPHPSKSFSQVRISNTKDSIKGEVKKLVNEKMRILLCVLIIIYGVLNAGVLKENVLTYDDLYHLQKDPDQLQKALDCTLSTIMYGEDQFSSQLEAEELLKRIYTKMELSKEYGMDDLVYEAIIKESSTELLLALKAIAEPTERYSKAYHLLDFVIKDFSILIDQFHFDNFKNFFQISKLKGFQLIQSIDGKLVQKLTEKLIETIIQSNYYLNNETNRSIVQLGEEKLLNYLSIQINPYLNKDQLESYDSQYSLLKSYLDLYQDYYGDSFSEKIPQEKYEYYLDLKEYFEYLSNVEILSRRLLTVENETLNSLYPVFFEYIKQYTQIELKSERLKNVVHSMIKNALTRYSYEDQKVMISNNTFEDITLSDNDLNNSLMNLKSKLYPETKEDNHHEKQQLFPFINNPSFFFLVFLIFGFISILLISLPIKLKAALLKTVGMKTKSLSLFEKAAIKHPMDPDIHIKIAQIYEKLGREEDAMNEYKIASKVLDMKEE